MCRYIEKMKSFSKEELDKILKSYDNREILKQSLLHISDHVRELADTV